MKIRVVLSLSILLAMVSAMLVSAPARTVLAAQPGDVATWGINWHGELGNGTTRDRNVAGLVSGLDGSVIAVDGNGGHSLALLNDGTVRAWGSNSGGELGDGTTTNRPTPVPVSGLTGVTAVAAGNTFSLALLSDGTVRNWGSGGSTSMQTTPVQVPGLTGVIAIAAGDYHALALLADGTVRAWGPNNHGKLGDGTTTDRPTPVPVSGLTGVTAIAAGWETSFAVLRDGTVRAWGRNGDNELGDGTTTDRPTPVPVSGLTGVTAVAAGLVSFALLADGTVRAWGDNEWGQLGDGTKTDRPTPVPVSGLTGVTAITTACNGLHTFALLRDGTVRAWGLNSYGELGNGTYTTSITPTTIPALTGVAAVVATNAGGLALGNFAPSSSPSPSPVPQPSASPSLPPLAPLTSYVALGDSYSSGEGLDPYLGGSDTDTDKCHRSVRGYPALVANSLGIANWPFLACSGAVTSYYYQGYQKPDKMEKEQRLGLQAANPGLVTLTFGGNDADWVGLLASCKRVRDMTDHIDVKPWSSKDDCYARLAAAPGLITEPTQGIQTRLYALYRQTLRDAPSAQIRVLTYPAMFPELAPDRTNPCVLGTKAPLGIVTIDAPVERQMVALQKQLNQAIRDTVSDIRSSDPDAARRLQVVDIEQLLGGYGPGGHTVSCGIKGRPEPWIKAVRMDGDIWDKLGSLLSYTSGSFHPTAEGHRQMSYWVLQSLNQPATVNIPRTPGGIVSIDNAAKVGNAIVGASFTATAIPDPGMMLIGWQGTGFTGTGGPAPRGATAASGQPALAATAPSESPPMAWGNPLRAVITGTSVTLQPVFAPRPAFADVSPQTTGATEQIAQLAARGIIKGCDQSVAPPLFCPTDPTLRAQMAALLVRTMGWGGERPANPFTDRDGVDDELWQAIAILADHGVAKGYGDGTYGTTSPVLNAQVISFITRAMVAQGYWEPQGDDGTLYPNVPIDSGHREDLVTYGHYAGTVRGADLPEGDFAGWDQPSSRAWFAFALWQALDSYFGPAGTP